MRYGFTLIELLIVVAIISILSSIAVPNFLEAQTRAKVSRAKADMATLGTALEIYIVDHSVYPRRRHPEYERGRYAPLLTTRMDDMRVITTPVAYLTRLPVDVFEMAVPPPLNLIDYFDCEQTNVLAGQVQGKKDAGVRYWMLLSVGPDGYLGVTHTGMPGGYPAQPPLVEFTIILEYDPTNGTIAPGNIYRLQGGASFSQVVRGK